MEYERACKFLQNSKMVGHMPTSVINELNYLASLVQDNVSLIHSGKIPLIQVTELMQKYNNSTKEQCRKMFVQLLEKAAPNWKLHLSGKTNKVCANEIQTEPIDILEVSSSQKGVRSMSTDGLRRKVWGSVRRIGGLYEFIDNRFRTPLKETLRPEPTHHSEKAMLKTHAVFPQISPLKMEASSSLTMRERSENKLLQKINEIDMQIKEQFANHNSGFDAAPDVVVSKSISDLNIALLTEYFLPKIKILKYGVKDYTKIKQTSSSVEAGFIKNIFSFFGSVVDCYVEISQKMKVQLERRRAHEQELISYIDEMLLGVEAVKELKDMKNFEIGLFGISKKTEQEYITNLNRARQNLFASKEDAPRKMDSMIDELQRYIEEKNTVLLKLLFSKTTVIRVDRMWDGILNIC